MNIYRSLNELIEYIENNLDKDIEYNKLAQILGTNEYASKRVFSLLSNVSLAEYIRNRRLSNAGFDLYKGKEKLIDIALKYQYESVTAFSRAFERFHGIKPSKVKNNPEKLKVYAKLKFNEELNQTSNMEYSIVELDEIVLYGVGIKTEEGAIRQDAPKFFQKMDEKYKNTYGEIDYGLVFYEARFDSCNFEYWIAYKKKIEEFKQIVIPKSKWLKFKINNQDYKDIQKVSIEFYEQFVPSSKYKLKPFPELEYYHDDITEFLVAIED